ncbi:MAG: MFS transporter [Streptosporangiaceae bacterium]
MPAADLPAADLPDAGVTDLPGAGVTAATGPGVAPGRGAARAGYREVLGVPEFRAIFVADVVSMLGNVVAAVALTVLVYQQTRSPALAASVMALSFLPYAIGGLLFGAAADRMRPRRVLVAGDLASGMLIGCMLIPGLPLAGLLLLLLGTGLIAPVYQSARSALLPEILPPGPRYILGRSMMRMVAQSAQIVGYGLGGLLLAVLSARAALAADAASFAASALLLRLGVRSRAPRAAGRGSMARDSLTGLRDVLRHRATRRVLLFTWLVPACAVAPEALAAPYAVHIGQPARAAAFLLIGLPAGVVLADIVTARLLPARWQRRIMVPAALFSFACLAGLAASPALIPAMALLAAAGLGTAWGAGIDGLLLDAAPAGLRSRALAAMTAGLLFIQGFGFALWGIAGQFAPVTVVIPAAAVLGAVVVLLVRPGRGR